MSWLRLPSHPKGLVQRGFRPLSFRSRPKQVPDLCPEPFVFQRSICRLETPGLAPGTSSFNGPSIPATNLVTFGKSSENSSESPNSHLLPLAARFPDRLLLTLCHPCTEGRPDTALFPPVTFRAGLQAARPCGERSGHDI